MKQSVAAIETKYGGVTFRSRTEARWAVHLDSWRIDWEYEREPVETRHGIYLADFWLPRLKVWLEIKGQQVTNTELEKCVDLAETTRRPVWIAEGIPKKDGNIRLVLPLGFYLVEIDEASDDRRIWHPNKRVMPETFSITGWNTKDTLSRFLITASSNDGLPFGSDIFFDGRSNNLWVSHHGFDFDDCEAARSHRFGR